MKGLKETMNSMGIGSNWAKVVKPAVGKSDRRLNAYEGFKNKVGEGEGEYMCGGSWK